MKKVQEKKESIIELDKTWRYRRSDPNVLLLDYCQYKIDNEEWSNNVPVWKVQQVAEQTKREIIVSLRFTFTTKFTIKKKRSIYLVMESPEKYSIKINGQEIEYSDIGYWLDKSFKKVNISNQLQEGENIIELSIPFMKPKAPNTLTYVKDGVEL